MKTPPTTKPAYRCKAFVIDRDGIPIRRAFDLDSGLRYAKQCGGMLAPYTPERLTEYRTTKRRIY